jgi:hypothetical protein
MTRTRTTERKRVRDKQNRRRRLVMIAVGAATAVALLALFLLTANQTVEAPIAEGAFERFPSELEGRTSEGYPRFGLASAPVQVSWFCQFDSLDCVNFHNEAIDQLAAWARDGEIVLTYVPLYGQSGNTRGAARSVVCAAQQEQAWPLISTFYGWRLAYGDVPAFTNNRLVSGLNQIETLDRGAYDNCIRGDAPDITLTEAQTDVRGLSTVGFNQPPPAVTQNGVVLVVDGQQMRNAADVLAALEAAINRTAPVTPATQPAADVTEEAPEVEATEAADAVDVTEEAPVAAIDTTPEADATAEATPD